ncbi:MAG: hypothetical protein IKK43_05445 [Clostridia bacterium]|nr:hypothetical protein [Clostridia bacterium]
MEDVKIRFNFKARMKNECEEAEHQGTECGRQAAYNALEALERLIFEIQVNAVEIRLNAIWPCWSVKKLGESPEWAPEPKAYTRLIGVECRHAFKEAFRKAFCEEFEKVDIHIEGSPGKAEWSRYNYFAQK